MDNRPELALVVLRCADLERAREFYAALGLTLVEEQHGTGAPHYSTTLGATVLELYPLQTDRTSGVRIGLRVADVDQAVDAVRRVGGAVVRATAHEAIVRDFDGHTIHLTSR